MSKILIVGKSGSGKNGLKNKLTQKGFTKSISYTTRTPRPEEINGEDYYFISDEQFDNLSRCNFFRESFQKNGYFYGTTVYDWNSKKVFIMDPLAIENLTAEERSECIVMYLNKSIQNRMTRLIKRGDLIHIASIIKEEDEEFLNFKDYDIRVTSPNI